MKSKALLVTSLLMGMALTVPSVSRGATVAHVEQFRVGIGSLVAPGDQFSDPFSDGLPPPLGPLTVMPPPPQLPYPSTQLGLPASLNVYGVNASPIGLPLQEANDKLYLDSSKGNVTFNALGQPRLVTGINLLTNTQMTACAVPPGCTSGLRRNVGFVASVLFELTPLNAPIDFQVLSIGDRRPDPADATRAIGGNVQFGPLMDTDGQTYLALVAQQYGAGTRNVVRRELLAAPSGADGVTLLFEHVAGSRDVFAYYRYYDDQRSTGSGLVAMGPLVHFATAADALFNDGSDWARAGISISQAVPEPGTWAMVLVALCVIGLRLRQRGRKTSSATSLRYG